MLVNIIKFHHYKYIEYYVLSTILGLFTYSLYPILVFWGFQVNKGNGDCRGHC